MDVKYDQKGTANMSVAVQQSDNVSLTNIITTAIQVPGVKVNREAFLCDVFKECDAEKRKHILEVGPVQAGCSRKELQAIAKRRVYDRTLASSGTSFLAGLPGGIAMAATIPADTLQFFGVSLKLAQELAYLYGEEDLWAMGKLDKEKVTDQLILYCGVMFGASGAAQTVKIMSSTLAKQALKKLPQQALTKTFYYPIVKSVAKALGARMTKGIFAKGVSKAIPIIGGVVSGGITFASMRPMGMRLADTLDEANFAYSEKKFEQDRSEVVNIGEEKAQMDDIGAADVAEETEASALEQIERAKKLADAGIITADEFAEIKAKLIAKL